MRPDERDAGLLHDMRAFAREAMEFTHGVTFDGYLADARLRRAVERVILLIGEAANHVSTTLQTAHPEIDWPGMIAMRHVIVHGYNRIDHARVWSAATEDAPKLLAALDAFDIE
jgi:uncharacterized protein with HEPN domain